MLTLNYYYSYQKGDIFKADGRSLKMMKTRMQYE